MLMSKNPLLVGIFALSLTSAAAAADLQQGAEASILLDDEVGKKKTDKDKKVAKVSFYVLEVKGSS